MAPFMFTKRYDPRTRRLVQTLARNADGETTFALHPFTSMSILSHFPDCCTPSLRSYKLCALPVQPPPPFLLNPLYKPPHTPSPPSPTAASPHSSTPTTATPPRATSAVRSAYATQPTTALSHPSAAPPSRGGGNLLAATWYRGCVGRGQARRGLGGCGVGGGPRWCRGGGRGGLERGEGAGGSGGD